ncbi:MAG: type II secretion system protein J [Phycisphaerales bacterium JB065]
MSRAIRSIRSRSASGFSLIEMVLSLTLVGLVLASLGSVLAFSMGAAPKSDDPSSRLRETQFPLSVMTEEIASATSFISIATQKIVFEVADRTGDASPDTITYSWDGTPGSPLLRTVNADDAVVVLDEIDDIAFTPTTTDHSFTTLYPGTETDFEYELSAGKSILSQVVALLNSRMQDINLDYGYFQRLRTPAVPGDALYWSPDYAEVLMARNYAPGAVRMELRLVEDGKPTKTAIASRVVRTGDLGGESWVRIDVPGTLRLNPSDEIGIVLICIDGHQSAEFRVFEQIVFPSDYPVKRSNDAGETWGGAYTIRMAYRLVGSYAPAYKSQTATTTVVERVRVELTPGVASQTNIVSEVDLPAPVRIEP